MQKNWNSVVEKGNENTLSTGHFRTVFNSSWEFETIYKPRNHYQPRRNKEPHGQIVTLKYHFPLKEIKEIINYL